jgi:hypothetical protein
MYDSSRWFQEVTVIIPDRGRVLGANRMSYHLNDELPILASGHDRQ